VAAINTADCGLTAKFYKKQKYLNIQNKVKCTK